jgi:hypothetical protein
MILLIQTYTTGLTPAKHSHFDINPLESLFDTSAQMITRMPH